MSVSVVPGSVKINVFDSPKAEDPEAPLRSIRPFGPTAPEPFLAGFQCTPISMGGEAKLTGSTSEIEACKLGFIQMQFVETFWCYYRGRANTDGSMLIQRGLPPARSQQVCRDCFDKYTSSIFYNMDLNGQPQPPIKNPHLISCTIEDQPSASAFLGQQNSMTGAANWLHEAQLERHFCAVLTLLTPDGKYHHLASRYWNVRWQAIFAPKDFDAPFSKGWNVRPVKGGMGSGVSKTILGPPGDHRFAKLLTTPGVPICNDLIKGATVIVDNMRLDRTVNPDFDKRTRREASTWKSFNVTH